MSYSRLAARLYGSPLLILPEKAKAIEEAFRAHLDGLAPPRRRAMEDDEETPAQRLERVHAGRVAAYAGIELKNQPEKPYALTTTGIAILPVLGTLVQRGSWMDAMSGLTSYDRVASTLERAMADPEARAVLLEIDSPGGEASGLIDLASRVLSARDRKTVWAVASEMAYSSAYWLASSARHVFVAETGGVGSIGALAMHVDQSKRDSMMGYKYELITSGSKKALTNSHAELSKSGRDWVQGEVDRIGGLFVQAIALNRGLKAEDVDATEAAPITPPEAYRDGYVDGINTLFETVALLNAELQAPGSTGTRLAAARQLNQEKTTMSTKAEQDAAEQARAAELEQARTAAKAEGATQGKAEGEKAGAEAERTRINAIMSCEEAKGRTKLATHLAMSTANSVEDAKKLLAASPKDGDANPFVAAMAQVANPKVGADGGDLSSAGGGQAPIGTTEIYAARAKQARDAVKQ